MDLMDLPFDFGAWSSKEPVVCPDHGPVTSGPALTVSAPNRQTVTRRYCPFCVIDALDQLCTVFGSASDPEHPEGSLPPPADKDKMTPSLTLEEERGSGDSEPGSRVSNPNSGATGAPEDGSLLHDGPSAAPPRPRS